MKKLLSGLSLVLCIHLAKAQTGIEWKDSVTVNDMPAYNAGKKDSEPQSAKFHRTYGSEYGRMVKLVSGKWLAAYTISQNTGYQNDPAGGFQLQVSESSDEGRTWKPISTLTDKGRDLDNAQMIQLADRSLLLSCRSVRWQESYRLPVYKSADNGRTWNKLSVIDFNEGKAGELCKPDKGIYEPHFYLLGDGRLSVMYANEKHVTDTVSYSQIISQRISPDNGRTWGQEIWVAYEPGHSESRPGMPVWTKMNNNEYIVVYEICGPEKCNVYYKISPDGFSWPVGLGTQIPEQLGGPYILSMLDGRLVVSSNKSNISFSNDFGSTWHLASPAWSTSVWSALYETRKGEVGVMNSRRRPWGGHAVKLRFGRSGTL